LVNSVIKDTSTKKEIISPREDLQQLVARKHEVEPIFISLLGNMTL